MPAFKPVTIPAKPATDRLDLDQVAFNDFSFSKPYIGMDQLCTVRYTATLFNAEQAAAATNPTKIVTVKKPQSEHREPLGDLPVNVLQAIATLQEWLTTVAVAAEVLEPAT